MDTGARITRARYRRMDLKYAHRTRRNAHVYEFCPIGSDAIDEIFSFVRPSFVQMTLDFDNSCGTESKQLGNT